MTQALITATAYIGDKPMRNYLDEIIQWTTESSTDIPQDNLGEAAVLALQAAWKTGIDPAVTEGFHIRITFN